MATGNKLVIVESPTKAKKIGGYLGDGYTVLASVGHIRDLAQPSQIPAGDKAKFGKFGVDVDDGFVPYYVIGADKKKTVAQLRKALKDADELYLATDEDREGEAIAWHLVETLKPKVPVKRMVFHEITKNAIQDALKHTRQVDGNMVDAQETRRILDRLYGYELSPVLWRKVGPGLSAGRVQSVATRLIVERERERMAFVRAPYWDVAMTAGAEDGTFESRLVQLGDARVVGSKDFDSQGKLTAAAAKEGVALVDEPKAQRIADAIVGGTATVTSMETKPYRRHPVPPFTTSTLQQAAGNTLGMSSRATMRAAQGLYENGYITYMRTDSVTLSQEAIAAARESVSDSFGDEYLSDKPKQYATRTAGAQEAHEAIRPAGAHFRTPQSLAASLPPDQLKLYSLIYSRTLASQMADVTGSTATVRLEVPTPEGPAVFQASGTVIDFPGFLAAYGNRGQSSKKDAGGDDVALPSMKQGDVLVVSEAHPVGHETQPPARYTEASLVRTLEAKEIGRPSTYASIISTIIDRGYVYERGRALIPSWLAFAVTNLLESNFPQYVDYEFTAQMENGLDQIASGKEKGKDWLTAFYFGTGDSSVSSPAEAHEGLHQQVSQLGDIDARKINTIEIGDGLQVRVGRYGPYLEDTKHLDAEGKPKRATIPDTIAPDELTVERGRQLIEENAGNPRELGVDPQTGGVVTVRTGRYGPYVALTMPKGDESPNGESASEGDKPRRTAHTSKKAAADKPKMASLFKTMTPESITLDQALQLLSLPRTVGEMEEADPTTGELVYVPVKATNGRYGPYITKTNPDGSTDSRSLGSEDEIFTVTLDQAKALFAQPRTGRRSRGSAKPPLRELGTDPESGKPVTIKDGFYGVYITDGTTNRTLPKQYTPESITPDEAYKLLAEKRAAGPTKRRRSTGRTTKAATKKTSTAKSTAKTGAAKTSAKSTTKTTRKRTTSTGAASAASKGSTASKRTTRTTRKRTDGEA